MKAIAKKIIFLTVAVVFGLSISYVQAQFAAVTQPIINTGNSSQIKGGGFEVSKTSGVFKSFGPSYLLGSDVYAGSQVSGAPLVDVNINGDMYINGISGDICADGNGQLIICP